MRGDEMKHCRFEKLPRPLWAMRQARGTERERACEARRARGEQLHTLHYITPLHPTSHVVVAVQYPNLNASKYHYEMTLLLYSTVYTNTS
jgi:hypothetical protein